MVRLRIETCHVPKKDDIVAFNVYQTIGVGMYNSAALAKINFDECVWTVIPRNKEICKRCQDCGLNLVDCLSDEHDTVPDSCPFIAEQAVEQEDND